MKNKVLFLAIAVLGASSLKAQLNVGSTSAADPSAILQATSTTKGFLPPSMTTAQIAAIVSPAKGLTVYDNQLNQLKVNVGTPAAPSWAVGAGAANVYWSQQGNTGTIPGTNYLGTTDNASLGFRTNGVERVRIDSSTGNVGIGLTTPYAPLQLASVQHNKSIVVYDDGNTAANDSTFYGFGVNGGALRYQVPGNAGRLHSFFNGKTKVAEINQTGEMNLTGTAPLIGFADATRPGKRGAIYTRDGVTRIYNNQFGDVLTADSLGHVGIGTLAPTTALDVNGSARIRTIPTSTSTQVLTTDGSGNIGQTTLQPTVFGVCCQVGVNGYNFSKDSTTQNFVGWSITIPALSKYRVHVNMLLGVNTSYIANSSIWFNTWLSTTAPSYTQYTTQGYGVANAPYPIVSGSYNTNANWQLMNGDFYVSNTNATPLVLYYFVNVSSVSGGYTGSFVVGNNNVENSLVGTPIN